MIIKILGTGCPNCLKMEANAKQAILELNIEAEVMKVTKLEEISAYGILRTPGFVVDEKVLSYGKVLTTQDMKALLVKQPGRLSL